MSAKIPSSLTEENRDLRKQIGCMNGIFQLFDRHHFLTGRRINSHSQNHKRLLLGPQHQKDPHCATKALTEKELEALREKSRISTESSRASYSSSCSSTFSSFDSNRTAQPETPTLRQINITDASSKRQHQHQFTKEMQSLDLRDVVKDSLYREARGLLIKSRSGDERRGQPMKHIDSPRPVLQQSKTEKPKAKGPDGSTRVPAKVQEGSKNKDERLALPRFSYDGRESQSAMKLKELPRLSLDSKTSSTKSSSLDSRVNFLRHNLHMENENSSQDFQTSQEPGTHSRSSSIVAKLMGLEDFPDPISPYNSTVPSPHPKEAFLSQLSTTAEKRNESHVAHSPRTSQTAASPSPRSQKYDSIRARCTSIPMAPAPWRQHDSGRGSPNIAPQDRKATTSIPSTSSVYGEMEKRITQLEFKKSGKDLRALKQILEVMHKTREHLEYQRGESAELTSERGSSLEDKYKQNPKFATGNNTRNYAPVPNIKKPSDKIQLDSSVVIMRPAKVIDKITVPSSQHLPITKIQHLRRLQIKDPNYLRDNPAHKTKEKDVAPKNKNRKDSSWHHPAEKTAALRTSEIVRTLRGTQQMNVENRNTSGRSFGMVSRRSQQSLYTREGQCHPTILPSESRRGRKHSSKELQGKGSRNRNQVPSRDLHLADDHSSDFSSETRYSSYQGDTASVKSESNNSMASQMETEFLSFAHSTARTAGQKQNFMWASREDMPMVELSRTIVEQPSPVSVLDAAFYSEDLPSPVKKISTAFQEDGNPRPDEAECNLENLNPSNDCITTHHIICNQKLEDMEHLVHDLRLLNTEPDEKAANQRASQSEGLNPDHRYISKILLTSGLLKDTSFISTGDLQPSSCHLINPDKFHVLEQTESILDRADGELIEKNDQMKLTRKSRRKIVFDLVNEILVRQCTPGILFAVRKKRIGPEGLLKKVYSEIDRLQNMPCCSFDDEDDGLPRILNEDIMYQSEDWAEYSSEVPTLVLDIERLIFKDLINEVVTGEAQHLHDGPKRHCRQLFMK